MTSWSGVWKFVPEPPIITFFFSFCSCQIRKSVPVAGDSVRGDGIHRVKVCLQRDPVQLRLEKPPGIKLYKGTNYPIYFFDLLFILIPGLDEDVWHPGDVGAPAQDQIPVGRGQDQRKVSQRQVQNNRTQNQVNKSKSNLIYIDFKKNPLKIGLFFLVKGD